MFKYSLITLVVILLSCLIISCSKSTRNETDDEKTGLPPVEFTPKENEEAELAALCLSGELVAPDSLYNQILNDLAAIRATFGESLEVVIRVKFKPPWIAGCLIVGFDSITAQQIANGEYHAWDELNQQYQVTKIDTHLIDFIKVVILHFKGRLHPLRLAEIYRGLPGVMYTEPNGLIGDGPNIHLNQTGNGITYLFRDAWGDCPSGCIYSEYWYFIFEGGQPVFVGHWAPRNDPNKPEWREEARLNKEHYCD